MYLGIDIGGTHVKIGIVSENGVILKKNSYPTDINNYEIPMFDAVKDGISKFITEYNVDLSTIQLIGVSATGQIDSIKGVVTGGGHIHGWIGSHIADELESIYNIPTHVENDANCAAVAEKWVGKAKDIENYIFATIGTGIGGGIIINNQLYKGNSGIASEIGHQTINMFGPKCRCGNNGCYETYASTKALIKKFIEEYPVTKDISEVDGRYIFELASKNDEQALRIVHQWIDYVAAGLVSLCNIVEPNTIFIGGGVSKQQELFIDPLREKVKKILMPNFKKSVKIEASGLENDAGMIGAVYLSINQSKKV